MLGKERMEVFNRWMSAIKEPADRQSLRAMQDYPEEQEDAFYRDLEFGTGGLRGTLGMGTNRMNVYTVAKATQGFANYLWEKVKRHPIVAISYDSRIQSDEFARVAAEVFAGNGIKVWLYDRLMPTPCLSYAVRALHCDGGIMVTASHNPAKYNGYKVYGADGCQITTEAAAQILQQIDDIDIFTNIKSDDFDKEVVRGHIQYVGEDVVTGFIEEVKKQSLLSEDAQVDRSVSIVYSPLNGTGREPVLRALQEMGYTNVSVVKEQETPDGHFPTCPFPNPEMEEAMELGMACAAKEQAQLFLATDPDCDRVGAAVRQADGTYRLVSGNEMGLLLLNYICMQRMAQGKMPSNPVTVKTIVTTDLAEKIAAHYGVRIINVLTGFKFIGEQIGFLEKEHKEGSYIFGFEESYGYLSGSYVRDKDGVNAATLICEMFAYYQSKGVSLLEQLQALYDTFGYCKNTLYSFTFEGASGQEKMKELMRMFREAFHQVAGFSILEKKDYALGVDGLPKSDVLKYKLSGGHSIVVRPSGTEPKMKVYLSVNGADATEASQTEEKLAGELKALFA